MSAAVQLYKECKAAKILPVFGMIANVVPDMSAKRQGKESLTLIAMNRTGFFNLVKIATIGAMYFYYIPRVSFEVIAKHSEGIIALTGGLDGIVAKSFIRDGKNGIAKSSEMLRAAFGDRVFHEIQPVPVESQKLYNENLMIYGDGNSLRMIATGTPLYVKREHAELHEMLYKARSFKKGESIYPLKGSYHVKSYEEMLDDFSNLHGFGVYEMDDFINPMKASDDLLEDIESFDLRDGVKVPLFQST
jgi:DNA polymerase-3 subunit alpha